MKKFLVNIFILISLFIFLDVLAYCFETFELYKFNKDSSFDLSNYPSYFENIRKPYDETTIKYFEENKDINGFRKPAGLTFNKAPIWLFGCSFVYGVDLADQQSIKEEDIFSYKLAKITKRPVYNFAYPSWGLQHMFYFLSKQDFYKDKIEPEYVVYVFIADHARRLNKLIYDPWSTGVYLHYYTDKNGNLHKLEPVFERLWNSHIVRTVLTSYEYKYSLDYRNRDKIFDLIEKMLYESKNELKKHYPNAKFVILKYKGCDGFPDWYIETERWDKLKDNFIILDTESLTGIDLRQQEYVAGDKYHPNSKAWDIVTEKLGKLINSKSI